MSAKKSRVTEARLLVRYGEFLPGDTIKGDLAAVLVERGMAKNMTPSSSRKAQKAAAKKAKTKGAPENKGDGFNPEE